MTSSWTGWRWSSPFPPAGNGPRHCWACLGQLSGSDGGRVVTCTAGFNEADAAGLGRATRQIGLHVVVATGPGAPVPELERTAVVRADGRRELSEAWASDLAAADAGAPGR